MIHTLTFPLWWIAVGGAPLIVSVLGLPLIAWRPWPGAAQKPTLGDHIALLPGGVAFLALTLVLWDGLRDLHRVIHGDSGTVLPGPLAAALLMCAAASMAFGPAMVFGWTVRRLAPGFDRWLKARVTPPPRPPTALRTAGAVIFYALLCAAGMAQGVFAALEPWAR